MKTILVPTDFSRTAANAVDYAAELAQVTQSKLILFHAYMLPVAPTETPLPFPTVEMEKETLRDLHKIEKHIRSKHGNGISIDCQFTFGAPVDEIVEAAKKNKADLIVMGMQGAGFLAEKLIGSVTTFLMRKSTIPVLAIEHHVKFRSIEKIALACDYEQMNNKEVLEPVKAFAKLFNAHLYILNVVKEVEEIATVTKTVEEIKLNRLLESIPHSFHHAENEDVIEGINHFAAEEKIDMLVLIPKKHSMLYNLFHESHTKQMAFHTKVPVLAIHE